MNAPAAELTRLLQEVEQQVAAMIRLVEADDPCLEIVRQSQAARQRLERASLLLLDSCLQTSAVQAVDCPDAACRVQQVARLNELYEALRRLTTV